MVDIGEGVLANLALKHQAPCPLCGAAADEVDEDAKSDIEANADADTWPWAENGKLKSNLSTDPSWEVEPSKGGGKSRKRKADGWIENDATKLAKGMTQAGSPRRAGFVTMGYSSAGTFSESSSQTELFDAAEQIRSSTSRKIRVTANPHHLIPGNESMKKAAALRKWIFAEEGVIRADIGYDINDGQNGIWLPSNNYMRINGEWAKANGWLWDRATNFDFMTAYAFAAMEQTNYQFHDRHEVYSQFVLRILNKIAVRMWQDAEANEDCPYGGKSSGAGADGKYAPPVQLVARLNGVSQRVASYMHMSKEPTPFVYTSEFVLKYWQYRNTAPKALADEPGDDEGESTINQGVTLVSKFV